MVDRRGASLTARAFIDGRDVGHLLGPTPSLAEVMALAIEKPYLVRPGFGDPGRLLFAASRPIPPPGTAAAVASSMIPPRRHPGSIDQGVRGGIIPGPTPSGDTWLRSAVGARHKLRSPSAPGWFVPD
jgi:hypothetical protein